MFLLFKVAASSDLSLHTTLLIVGVAEYVPLSFPRNTLLTYKQPSLLIAASITIGGIVIQCASSGSVYDMFHSHMFRAMLTATQ